MLAMAYGVVLSSNASARGSSAALGVASVEVNGGAVDAAPSVVEFVKPFAGHFKSIGDWPEEYMVLNRGRPAASVTASSNHIIGPRNRVVSASCSHSSIVIFLGINMNGTRPPSAM